ncbi:TIGR03087 family PEP-CTERM/XrtA system glycosyltransferase [Photobacterium chitinilyticum]|uniref:TIGR03087 family PEP-CTERM/XrtA system glycosyltransferase n=1 Tax=Photobacterium chitinilyticum TaxID=2485123 RepID=A0A444JSW1_9GAMM|nr:TIGR03087 family PEP-CTERM/XrtA system glycosyltransferase [Photobacterium chitinilyticum]RWX56078.1 TIGR03087 family PEP-CTERM/XrtA system glycosyltransferase [Photobacterium chitinilyticum]
MKEPLLYLCHRIPYPPNKGDKIANYHILKYLSRHFDVYLGCFIDDPFDLQYQSKVKKYCKESLFISISPSFSKLKGASALLTGKPITLPYYSRKEMQQWVDSTIEQHQVSKAFVVSGCMAQYLLSSRYRPRTVMHFVDIDSDKWRQYAEKKQGIMRAVYRREHRTLERYEKKVASTFEISCFVTEAETRAFRHMADNRIRGRIKTLENGLDSQFFSSSVSTPLAEAYRLEDENYVVFTGVMDYWANEDAVAWFARVVWPKVLAEIPDGKFYIVGSSPTAKVKSLAEIPGIIVTGRVVDVRPYLQKAKAAVAPMRIARGVQNKILEAMSMSRAVIASPQGMEGLDNYPPCHVAVSDSPSDIAGWVVDKLKAKQSVATESREWIEQHYSWDAQLSPLLGYLEPSHAEFKACRTNTELMKTGR